MRAAETDGGFNAIVSRELHCALWRRHTHLQKRERLKPFASPLCAKTALQLRDERGLGLPHEDWFTFGLSFANAITKKAWIV